jgi:hypothetical protein
MTMFFLFVYKYSGVHMEGFRDKSSPQEHKKSIMVYDKNNGLGEILR